MPNDQRNRDAAQVLANALSAATGGALESVVKRIKELGQDGTQGASPRLFFPNGIERIGLTINVEKVGSVILEIAGEKGGRPGTSSGANTGARTIDVEAMDGLLNFDPTVTTPARLAQQILSEPRITLATSHPTTPPDGATARENLVDTAGGRSATRSQPDPPGSGNPPGGSVMLSERMLTGMLALAADYPFTVSEVAGGKHNANSRHYRGLGFDVSVIDGAAVRAGHQSVDGFKRRCRQLGATEVLGPGDNGHSTHVHAAWPASAFTLEVEVADGADVACEH